MAYPYGGRWGIIKVASKASTDYDIGDILSDDATNPVLGSGSSTNIMGFCVTDKPSSDTTTGDIYIKVPKDRSATFLAAVTGTFTKAYEGRYFDLSDELTVDTAATTHKVVRCVKFINSTTGVFSINDPIA